MIKIVFCFLLVTGTTLCIGQKSSQVLNLRNGVALDGYDAVSYINGRATKGKPEFSMKYDNAIYYFSTPGNLEQFKGSPEKYVPQYGGWCAYAMGNDGDKVDVDPETFKVQDGKLYLFYNRFFNNTLTKWNMDEKELKRKADMNWRKLTESAGLNK
jgi:YHS domain-containing protein